MDHRLRYNAVLIFLLSAILLATPGARAAEDGRFAPVARLIGSHDAVLVIAPENRVCFAKNADTRLIPASTLKLLTCLAALEILGPDFRFKTEFYIDPAGNLEIKGYGDPLLISEVLAPLGRQLAARVSQVGDLILDDTFFEDPIVVPGISDIPTTNPYDAPNSALSVNFNTIHFIREGGVFKSAEPQTPLLPFAAERIRNAGQSGGRIILSHLHNESTLYAGHLIRYFLEQGGVRINGTIRRGNIEPATDKLIYTQVSPFTLSQAVSKLLEHSNNFMANQLFLTCGARRLGAPATIQKGVRMLETFAGQALDLHDLQIREGSGLSRQNRISAAGMQKVLARFAPYKQLMRHQDREFYKTGSLTGVKARAGYIQSAQGGFYRFVVLLNTPGKTADQVTDRLVPLLP